MARKKPTKTQQTRRNVQRAVKRAEERGYRFSDEFKEEIKQASYQKLKSIQSKGYRGLYTESTYIDPETGEIVKGWQARLNELSAAAKKGAETKTFEQPQDIEAWRERIMQTPTEWRRYIREKQKKDKKVVEQAVINGINMIGAAAFRNLYDTVTTNSGTPGADVVLNWITARTRELGAETFIMSLALTDHEGLLDAAFNVAVMDSDQLKANYHVSFLLYMSELIHDGSVTVDKAKMLGHALEQMEGPD